MKLNDILLEAIKPDLWEYDEIINKVMRIAPYMSAIGKAVNGPNIAYVLGMKDADRCAEVIQQAVDIGHLDRDDLTPSNASISGNSDVDKLLVDMFIMANRKGAGGGAMRASERTGIPVERIAQLVDEYSEDFEQAASAFGFTFRPAYFSAPTVHPTMTKKALGDIGRGKREERDNVLMHVIRKAVMQATDNGNEKFIGTITGRNLAPIVGVSHTTIDRILNRPEMKDLDIFRYFGQNSETSGKTRIARRAGMAPIGTPLPKLQ